LVVRHSQQRQYPRAQRQRRGSDCGPAQAYIGLERFGIAEAIERAQRAVAEEVQMDAALHRRATDVAMIGRDDMHAMAASYQPGGDLLDEWRGRFPRVFGVRRCEHANVHSILDLRFWILDLQISNRKSKIQNHKLARVEAPQRRRRIVRSDRLQ
jgi:hypothetical protein